ncbi:hypothetical protein CROQUDRAFT_718114 [Cronartium quercuum f. sp. fusiforme G11]|uniref:C3H1-type domain-containing protein n=1 Tax=Cronartium quercuum f. sp. fusiforme G11 TaxID=708437 RepID=A0A9P6N9M7_9BASI|nr:hypothetical protein CROQUDRAFT_718114 [Cronartium quercuum f. sp. fusiforme G11]
MPDPQGKSTAHRGASRGRSNTRSFRGRPASFLGHGESRPPHTTKPLDGPKAHQLPACLPQRPITNPPGMGHSPSGSHHQNANLNSSNLHYTERQNPGFTNQLAASINSVLQTVLPGPCAAQPILSNPGNTTLYHSSHAHSFNNGGGGVFQPRAFPNTCGAPAHGPNFQFGRPFQPFQGQQYNPSGQPQPSNLFQQTYTPNPSSYYPAFNPMMPNHNCPGGYNLSNPVYHHSQPSAYPQPPYLGAQALPPPNYLPAPQAHWTPDHQAPPRVTAEGYTISGTADNDCASQSDRRAKKARFNNQGRNSNGERHRCGPCQQDFPNFPALVMHRNGHQKCSESGCKYEGNPKSVEIHEEDRHLRFKPGKEPRNARPDGPANATIQGLGYALNTEEEVAKWIAERRKRWPTAKVIAEKAMSRSGAFGPSQEKGPSRGRGDRSAAGVRGKGERGQGCDSISSLRTAQILGSSSPAKSSGTTLLQKRQRDPEDSSADDDGDDEVVSRPRLLATKAAAEVCSLSNPVSAFSDEEGGRKGENEELRALSYGVSEDMDTVKDAISSKVVPRHLRATESHNSGLNTEDRIPTVHERTDSQEIQNVNNKRTTICKWWRMKRCKRGDSCMFLHPTRNLSSKKPTAHKRNLTQAASCQPMTGSGLLSKVFPFPPTYKQLLQKDIQQDVLDLESVITFLVDNDFLDNTELRIGQSQEERLIQPISAGHPSSQRLAKTATLHTNESDESGTEGDSDDDAEGESDEEGSATTPNSIALHETLARKGADLNITVKQMSVPSNMSTLGYIDDTLT